LTEALGATLRAAPAAARALVMHWNPDFDLGGNSGVRVWTQVPISSGFIDLEVAVGPEHAPQALVWIEVKLDARRSGDDQLLRYRKELAGKGARQEALVYLTRHGDPTTAEEDAVRASWTDVGHELSRWACSGSLGVDSHARCMVEEFVNYLVEEGLTVTKPFDADQALALANIDLAANTLSYVLESALDQIGSAGWIETDRRQPLKYLQHTFWLWRSYEPQPSGAYPGCVFEVVFGPWTDDGTPLLGAGVGYRPTDSANPLEDDTWNARMAQLDFVQVSYNFSRRFRCRSLEDLAKLDTLDKQIASTKGFVVDAFKLLAENPPPPVFADDI
jgi:hypothetical protein